MCGGKVWRGKRKEQEQGMGYMCHEGSRENEAHPQEGKMKDAEGRLGRKFWKETAPTRPD